MARTSLHFKIFARLIILIQFRIWTKLRVRNFDPHLAKNMNVLKQQKTQKLKRAISSSFCIYWSLRL